jgi:hypothetical protein
MDVRVVLTLSKECMVVSPLGVQSYDLERRRLLL